MTIGQVLLGLAAGLDSIYIILAWLIMGSKIDPHKTLFSGGQTVLHIASKRGCIITAVWLCRNGVSDFLDVKDDDGKQPMHLDAYMSLFLSLEKEHPLPSDWIALPLASEDLEVAEVGRFFSKTSIREGVKSLFESKSWAENILRACAEGNFFSFTRLFGEARSIAEFQGIIREQEQRLEEALCLTGGYYPRLFLNTDTIPSSNVYVKLVDLLACMLDEFKVNGDSLKDLNRPTVL
ncbi:hypothetical protein HDU67_007292 [Dinochytrium kinnereticum]|nr:hypothetical protein HDU67_007292 [Dinochytrium kinnereticum]